MPTVAQRPLTEVEENRARCALCYLNKYIKKKRREDTMLQLYIEFPFLYAFKVVEIVKGRQGPSGVVRGRRGRQALSALNRQGPRGSSPKFRTTIETTTTGTELHKPI